MRKQTQDYNDRFIAIEQIFKKELELSAPYPHRQYEDRLLSNESGDYEKVNAKRPESRESRFFENRLLAIEKNLNELKPKITTVKSESFDSYNGKKEQYKSLR